MRTKCKFCGKGYYQKHPDSSKAAHGQKYCSKCGMTYSPQSQVKDNYACFHKGKIVTGKIGDKKHKEITGE